MGVPKFAAWLSKKYANMVSKTTPPNVHGLYIDLNGLIHPCCHDEHDPSVALRPEAAKLRSICLAIETLVVTTKPQHVVYIATDGVAPRAKMNQQRARRYMSAAEPADQDGSDAVADIEHEFTANEKASADEDIAAVGEALLADPLYGGTHTTGVAPATAAATEPAGLGVSSSAPAPHDARAGVFDSNCISPGTVFMDKVATAVREYVEEKLLMKHALWCKLKVVLSDSNTAGEGEHKIIDFIRSESSHPGFSSHGAHVICGLDADLIFLSLALHIPRVFILRDNKRSSSYGKRPAATGAGDASAPVDGPSPEQPHLLIKAAAQEEVEACTSYEFYAVDIIGSSLVSEVFWLCQVKGYRPRVHPGGAGQEPIVAANGYLFRCPPRPPPPTALATAADALGLCTDPSVADVWPCTAPSNSKIVDDLVVLGVLLGNDFLPHLPSAFSGESSMDELVEIYVGAVLPFGYLTAGDHEIDRTQLERFLRAYAAVEAVKFRQQSIKAGLMTPAEAALPLKSAADERCWRQPYLRSTSITNDNVRDACRAYVAGIRFVWRYYSDITGTLSWAWFYSYYHAPFAADLADYLAGDDATMWPTDTPSAAARTPADPYAQLMSVLPPSSADLLPEVYRLYMRHPPADLKSTFPREWFVDRTAAYGKEHLATVMLPYANMGRLQQLVREFYSHLSEEEQRRGRNTSHHLVLQRPESPLGEGGYTIQGGELRPLATATVPWRPRPGLRYQVLVNQVAQPCRPRTYSHAMPVPGLSREANGQLTRHERRARHAGGTTTADEVDLAGAKGDAHNTRVASPTAPAPRRASLAEFVVLVGVVAFATSCVTAPRGGGIVHVQLLAVAVAATALCFVLGIALPEKRLKEIGIRRNNVRLTYVDWQCAACLSLNFARNLRCFQCGAPYDPCRSWALYSTVHQPEPPLMDPNHAPHQQVFRLKAQQL